MLELAVLAAHFALPSEGILGVAIVIMASLFIAVLVTAKEQSAEILAIFALALCLRIATTWIMHLGSVSAGEDGLFFRDSRAYDRVGWMIARLWREGESTDLTHFARGISTGFYRFTGINYFLFGHSILAVKTVLCALQAFTCVFVFKIGRELFSRNIAIAGALLTALNPSLVFWSGAILKDSLVSLLIVLWIWQVVCLSKRFSVSRVLVVVAAVAPLAVIRIYLFSLMLVFTAVWLLTVIRPRILSIAVAGGLCYAAIVAIPRFSLLGQLSLSELLAMILPVQEATAAETSVFAHTNIAGFIGAIKLLPFTLAHFLMTPLPWNTEGILRGLIPGTLLRYALWPAVILGGIEVVRRTGKLSVVILGLPVVLPFVYALLFLGSGPRWHAQTLPIMMLLAAVGFYRSKYLLPAYVAYVGIVVVAMAAFMSSPEMIAATAVVIMVIALVGLRTRRLNPARI
jgi:hypothetical protein